MYIKSLKSATESVILSFTNYIDSEDRTLRTLEVWKVQFLTTNKSIFKF